MCLWVPCVDSTCSCRVPVIVLSLGGPGLSPCCVGIIAGVWVGVCGEGGVGVFFLLVSVGGGAVFVRVGGIPGMFAAFNACPPNYLVCRWATRTVAYVGGVEGAVTVKCAMTCTALKVLLSAVRSTTTEPNMLIVPPIVIPDGSGGLVLGAGLPAAATADVNAAMVTTPAPGGGGPLS